MNIVGKVISIEMDKNITKQNGGSYKGTSLLYRDESGNAKEQNFHNNVLKFNPAVKSALQDLITGDMFTMVKEKEGEFWNVKSITKNAGNSGVNGEVNVTAAVSKVTPASKGGSTWETAEERARKQVLIVRQSSLSSAVAYAATKKVPPTVEEILEVAKAFEGYVFSEDDVEEPDMDLNVE